MAYLKLLIIRVLHLTNCQLKVVILDANVNQSALFGLCKITMLYLYVYDKTDKSWVQSKEFVLNFQQSCRLQDKPQQIYTGLKVKQKKGLSTD